MNMTLFQHLIPILIEEKIILSFLKVNEITVYKFVKTFIGFTSVPKYFNPIRNDKIKSLKDLKL